MSKPEGYIFSRGKPVAHKSLIMISVVYEVWNSIEQEFDGVTGFHCGITSGFNKFTVVNCFGTFLFFCPLNWLRIKKS